MQKEEFARTRANDSKYLPAVIPKVFFCEYTRVMFDIVISTKHLMIFIKKSYTFKSFIHIKP